MGGLAGVVNLLTRASCPREATLPLPPWWWGWAGGSGA